MSGIDDKTLITVSELLEHEDGSATAQIEASPEGVRMLVEIGLTALLEKAIAEDKVTIEQ
ncbi:MAG: hypothetical protein VW236_08400 [Flavobacteriaceae bacterium]